MVIGGVIILLIILGLFLEAVTMSPRSDAEWQKDTEDELSTTSSSHESQTHTPLAA
jgi:hypothetical protein